MQYAFGGLFSGYIIFYTRSASATVSWLFITILVLLWLGNERFRGRYKALGFQLGIFYLAIFSYAVFLIPLLLRRMGSSIFFLSGVFSLLVIFAFIWILTKINYETIYTKRNRLKFIITVIFLAFNFLYFTNIIPPIPLSVTDSGVYHQAIRTGDTYFLSKEDVPWWRFWARDEIHIGKGDPLYTFASIFAPTKFNEEIMG